MEPQLGAEIDFLAGRVPPLGDSGRLDVGLRARALVTAGRVDDARAQLAMLDLPTLSVHDRAAASWAASRVGPRSAIDALADSWRRGPDLVEADGIPLGPREWYLGMLLAAAADLPSAASALRRAASVGDERAPLWGAMTRAELARVLRCAEAVGDGTVVASSDQELVRVSVAARTFFTAGGYQGLLRRLHADVGDERRSGLAATATFLGGERWLGGFGVQPATAVQGGKGLLAIEYLLHQPGRVVTALELGRVVDGGDPESIAEAFSGLDLAALLDPRAASVPSEAVERLRTLAMDDGERSRVSKLLRRTTKRIAAEQPLLAAHLDVALRTGYACAYEPARPIEWVLSVR